MRILHKIKRLVQRLIIKSKRAKNKDSNSSKGIFEQEALRICRNLIRTSSTELLVCPDTHRRFIVCEEQQIKIIIYDNRIIISNHSYYYELAVSSDGISQIHRIFDGYVRERRNILETDIKNNAKNTLDNIIILTN